MPNCPICNAFIDDEKFTKVYISNYKSIKYKFYHCMDCSMQWWEPLKIIPEFYNRGEKLYQEILDKSGNVSGYTKQKSMRPFLEKLQVRFLENPPAREGRLLDVGCGSGLFLKEARELGFDVWGLDFNKKIVEIAKNISESENIYTESLEEFAGIATARNLKFDVITFFEVIEHQDNPNRFIENVKALLKNGGYIAFSCPNRERFLAGMERRNNRDLPPSHFLWFSKDVMKKLLEKNGFVDIEVYENNTLADAIAQTQLLFLGLGTRSFITRMFIKDSQIPEEFSIKTAEVLLYDSLQIKILKFLKLLGSIAFAPLGLLFYPFYIKKPPGLYFVGRKP